MATPTDEADPLESDDLELLDEPAVEDEPGQDPDPVDLHELPGADLSHETLRVQVVPVQSDEFTCARCFLVNHRTRLARNTKKESWCIDCD